MEIKDLPEEDQAAIKEMLQTWKAEGNENPMLPVDIDFNGDGLTDSIGLDDDGELVVISGVPVEETVYESEGDDITGPDDSQEGGE